MHTWVMSLSMGNIISECTKNISLCRSSSMLPYRISCVTTMWPRLLTTAPIQTKKFRCIHKVTKNACRHSQNISMWIPNIQFAIHSRYCWLLNGCRRATQHMIQNPIPGSESNKKREYFLGLGEKHETNITQCGDETSITQTTWDKYYSVRACDK